MYRKRNWDRLYFSGIPRSWDRHIFPIIPDFWALVLDTSSTACYEEITWFSDLLEMTNVIVLLWRQKGALKIMFAVKLPNLNFGIYIFNALSVILIPIHGASGSWKPLVNSEILFFVFLLVATFYLIWEISLSPQLVWLKLLRFSALWVGWGKVGLRLLQDKGA